MQDIKDLDLRHIWAIWVLLYTPHDVLKLPGDPLHASPWPPSPR